MRIGNLDGEIDQQILDLGFQVVDSCTLLGFKFSNRIGLALSNETDLVNKISNSLRFWTPFNLSLSGKITVAKSLILPLFIYYATVINFSSVTIETIEKKIETFVCGGLNISKEKIYALVTEGGINLFKLHDFALSLQCSWVKRTIILQHDNWRYRLFNASSASIFNMSRDEISVFGPILRGICMSYIKFRDSYGTVKNNFLTVPILDNENFFYKEGRIRKNFDKEFFGIQEGMVPDPAILKLKWEDFCDANWNFLAYDDILERVHIDFDQERVRKLLNGFQNARKKLFNENDNKVPVPEFFGTFKKRIKKFSYGPL
jgi:hypothetical protein